MNLAVHVRYNLFGLYLGTVSLFPVVHVLYLIPFFSLWFQLPSTSSFTTSRICWRPRGRESVTGSTRGQREVGGGCPRPWPRRSGADRSNCGGRSQIFGRTEASERPVCWKSGNIKMGNQRKLLFANMEKKIRRRNETKATKPNQSKQKSKVQYILLFSETSQCKRDFNETSLDC